MRADVVAAARLWLGTPYRHQASVIGVGCDCLGLIRGVWRQVIGDEPEPLPPYAPGLRQGAGKAGLEDVARRYLIPTSAEPEPADVVLFRLRRSAAPRHCGILIAPDRFIHAQEGLGVVEANLTDGWRQRLAGRFTFPQRD